MEELETNSHGRGPDGKRRQVAIEIENILRQKRKPTHGQTQAEIGTME